MVLQTIFDEHLMTMMMMVAEVSPICIWLSSGMSSVQDDLLPRGGGGAWAGQRGAGGGADGATAESKESGK